MPTPSPAPPLGPSPSHTEKGLRFIRPQLRRCPWWRLTLEGEGWTLSYVRPEPDYSDPVEPVVAALGWTSEGRWWGTWAPLETGLHDTVPPGNVLIALRQLIDLLRDCGGGDEPGWPAQVPLLVSVRHGRSERNILDKELSGDLILLILGLEEEGAQRVATGRAAASAAADATSLRWPFVAVPEVIEAIPDEVVIRPKTIRRPKKSDKN